jgi:DNA-binding MarR family transcriptional regulator
MGTEHDQNDQMVGELLHRFGLARDRLTTAICQATHLAPHELRALEYLEAEGPLTQRELGERISLSSGGVTQLVDRLERAGWVYRRPHPGDRRAVLLELDRRAANEALPLLEQFHARLAMAVSRITPSGREAVTAFLGVAAAAASETAAGLGAQAVAGSSDAAC